jgi:hypothetical protein
MQKKLKLNIKWLKYVDIKRKGNNRVKENEIPSPNTPPPPPPPPNPCLM